MIQELTLFLLSWSLKFVIIPLLGFFLLHGVINLRLLRRLKPISPIPGGENKSEGFLNVSVLVPARNEESRIRECLASLIAQHPPVREILLLDDRSTDRTAEIARELGFYEGEGHRLRLLRGIPLPEGWVGKNWACHQLSLAADRNSSHLLFTDADTIHSPSCLATALTHPEKEHLDLLSLWPDQSTGSWAEKLVIPLGYLLFLVFQPFALMAWLQACPQRVARWRFSRKRLASMGVANGQFLLFRRTIYEELGGHEILKHHLVEDVAFARRVAARTGEGMRLVNADGIELLRCRMYSNFSQLWEGFSKNLRPSFEESQGGFIFFGVVVSSLFLWPFFLLLVSCDTSLRHLGLIAVMLIVLLRLLLTVRFQTSWLSMIAHPFAMILILLIALNSWRLCLRGGVSWKGRTYSGATRSAWK